MEPEASRPTRRLMLVRHASSLSADPTGDVNRRLSQIGHAEADRLGRHLSGIDLDPSRVICSSARRARETIDDLLEHWPSAAPEVCIDERLYLASPERLLSLIAEAGRTETLLVVAHNPGIGQLAYDLARGDASGERIARGFPPASCATFAVDLDHWAKLAPGAARLEHFIRPDELG